MSLVDRDARSVWHPFTQHSIEKDFLPVREARDALLTLEDGRVIIDAISSWWSCLHGHCHPEIMKALSDQASRLDHVLFAGATHEPAVRLAERLIEVTPGSLQRVFFSDNGSTAVEVALKMTYQAWVHRGEPQRSVFLALKESYHGDTVGAMSVGDPDPFFEPYRPLLFEVRHVERTAEALRQTLEELGNRAAGLILEPLVQGAAGMVMHSPEFVREARQACTSFGVPLIADEVMTGFGRTGSTFACQQANVEPDLICLSKGLTGGVLPLSVTLCREELFEEFLSPDRRRAFVHGHTFTANPLGCAVALKSLELVERDAVPQKLDRLGQRIETQLRERLASHPRVKEIRRRGGIVAVEWNAAEGSDTGYYSGLGPIIRRESVARGVLLRPLGQVIYAMPPAATTDPQADQIAEVMAEMADLGSDS